MKKILLLILYMFLAITIMACDAFVIDETTSEVTHNFDAQPTTTDITTDLLTTEVPITQVPTTELPTSTEVLTADDGQAFIPQGYSLLQDELESFGIPAVGDAKVLVFAVDFPDSLHNENQASIADLEIAFNGNSDQLAFESVRSYYQISSYNKLNIQADVFGYYTLPENAAYYSEENEKYMKIDPVTGEYVYSEDEVIHVESEIIDILLSHYDHEIDYSDYDSNNDGLIDGIYIVYNYPSDPDSDLWWAYQYNYRHSQTYDGVSPDYYTWAATDFINEGEDLINARTFIHETGHMLGLDDYYDYSNEDTHNTGGLGTYMMDYTIGDHDPFSKILLGWIEPKVIETSSLVDINTIIDYGDVLLIIDEWNNSIFDEYLLVSYYKPEGLNASDLDFIFSVPGINIFHVAAEIGNGYLENSYYYTIFNNNNTDTTHKLINIVEADMNESIEEYEIIENSDLFQEGNILGTNVYPNYQWYNGSLINFTVSILDINNEGVTINIGQK